MPLPLMMLLLLPLGLTSSSTEARERIINAHQHHRVVGESDMDRTLRIRAEEIRAERWTNWEQHRPLSSYFPPVTRERVAAPPFTGYGYGGTIPGAWPGF